jgi:hypothetical protein
VLIVRSAAVAVALSLVAVPAAVAKPKKRPVHTIVLTAERAQTEQAVDDAGPAGFSKGDNYVSSAVLKDAEGGVVGSYELSCIVTDEADGTHAFSVCTGTAIFAGGTLVTAGAAELTPARQADGSNVPPPETILAIVGGTGRYTHARGQLHSTPNGATRTLRFSFRR